MTKLSLVLVLLMVRLSSFQAPETFSYPGNLRMPEATERLNKNKPSNWLQADTYHTDDSLKDVIRYFKAQTEKLKRAHEPEGMAKSLMRDNWKVRKTTAPWAHSIFLSATNSRL